MKRLAAVVAIVALVAVPVIAVKLYYDNRIRSIEAERDKYVEWAQQQKPVPVQFVVAAPEGTPVDQTLYLSGSAIELGNWDAAGVPLQRREDGKYHATVDLLSGIEHAFKVTRGTWSTVEKDPEGNELPNRTLAVGDADQVIQVPVARWVDEGKSIPGRVTVAGDLRLHRKFVSEILKNERTLAVWVPAGYDADEQRRYPVLYMQDGQNLFDESTSFAGVEWGVDEAAARLIAEGRIEPVIVVGVYNTETRSAEFTPSSLGGGSSGLSAEQYARFVVEEVKPFIDRTYRTQSGPDRTGIAGASRGAMATLAILRQFPETFGRVALLTPHLRVEDGKTLLDALGAPQFLAGKRLWIDMGSAGGHNYPSPDPIADARAFRAALESAGLSVGPAFIYAEYEGQEHIEAAWATRVEQVLQFLYPAAAN